MISSGLRLASATSLLPSRVWRERGERDSEVVLGCTSQDVLISSSVATGEMRIQAQVSSLLLGSENWHLSHDPVHNIQTTQHREIP